MIKGIKLVSFGLGIGLAAGLSLFRWSWGGTLLIIPAAAIIWISRRNPAFSLLGLLAGAALLAPMLAPFDATDRTAHLGFHLFGCDSLGRDLWSRMLMANGNSMAIALTGTLLACLAAIFSGGLIGLGPQWLRLAGKYLLQAFLSIPIMLIYLIILALAKPGAPTLIVAMGLTLWPELARLIESKIETLEEADFVQVARMQGLGELQIFTREILPNLRPLIVSNFLSTLITAIMIESALSYLGLGLPLGVPSIGNLIKEGTQAMRHQPQILIFGAGLLLVWIFLLRHMLGTRKKHSLSL